MYTWMHACIPASREGRGTGLYTFERIHTYMYTHAYIHTYIHTDVGRMHMFSLHINGHVHVNQMRLWLFTCTAVRAKVRHSPRGARNWRLEGLCDPVQPVPGYRYWLRNWMEVWVCRCRGPEVWPVELHQHVPVGTMRSSWHSVWLACKAVYLWVTKQHSKPFKFPVQIKAFREKLMVMETATNVQINQLPVLFSNWIANSFNVNLFYSFFSLDKQSVWTW